MINLRMYVSNYGEWAGFVKINESPPPGLWKRIAAYWCKAQAVDLDQKTSLTLKRKIEILVRISSIHLICFPATKQNVTEYLPIPISRAVPVKHRIISSFLWLWSSWVFHHGLVDPVLLYVSLSSRKVSLHLASL